jgi:hypothetical protein
MANSEEVFEVELAGCRAAAMIRESRRFSSLSTLPLIALCIVKNTATTTRAKRINRLLTSKNLRTMYSNATH